MPCDQYELQLKNNAVAPGGDLSSAVAELDPGTSTVLALQHGHTNIVLDHKSILPAWSRAITQNTPGVCFIPASRNRGLVTPHVSME